MEIKKKAKDLGLDENEFLELVKIFLEVSISDLNKLQSAFIKKDVKQVVEAAHSIKGAASNLEFQDIYEIAKGIEKNALKNKLKGIEKAIQLIREKLNLIAKELAI